MRVRAAAPPVAFPTPRGVSLALTRTLACTLACSALAGSIAPIRAQGAAAAAPHAVSIDRLARIDSALDRAARDERVAGAVLLVLRDGRVAYERAVGWADREARTRMTPLSIFRIASQSKAITSAAVMMLIEEGKLGLGDPVSRYLPTFARSRVAIKSDTGRALVPATRAITIRDLLTHTAGISYGTDSLVAPLYAAQGLGPAAGWGWYTADKDEPVCTTMDRLGTLPFVAQPGSAFGVTDRGHAEVSVTQASPACVGRIEVLLAPQAKSRRQSEPPWHREPLGKVLQGAAAGAPKRAYPQTAR